MGGDVYERIQCNVCGGYYTKENKSHHVKTMKHKNCEYKYADMEKLKKKLERYENVPGLKEEVKTLKGRNHEQKKYIL